MDSSGNPYEPYSLAWRLLGTYMDCDLQGEEGDEEEKDDEEHDGRRRRRLSGSGDGDDCQRKLLWAAYHNPKYRGDAIGEYQIYDWRTRSWDTSTCSGRKCTRMDCHETNTNWKLVGVFAETNGLYDWAEQLFKHEGYCVWDGDKEDEGGSGSGDGGDQESMSDYEFMQEMLSLWKEGCQQLYLTDSSGNTLYVDTTPQAGGNFTYDIYTDEDCTEMASMTMYEYIIKFYAYYYYDRNLGLQEAEKHQMGIERWNYLLNDFKVCQPCRAYNRVPTYQDDDEKDEHRRFQRLLEEEEGNGGEEPNGFNCYDDAGYRNCNQCYKFESKTDMELASQDDLARASAQGTILAVKMDGVLYGEPVPFADNFVEQSLKGFFAFIAVAGLIAIAFLVYRQSDRIGELVGKLQARRRRRRRGRGKRVEDNGFPAHFSESFVDEDEKDGVYKSADDANRDDRKTVQELEEALAQKDRLLQEQNEELERLRFQLKSLVKK